MGKRGRPVDTKYDAEISGLVSAGSAQVDVARALGISRVQVHRVCQRLGLVCDRATGRHRGRAPSYESLRHEAAVQELAESGLTGPQIAEKLKIKRHTVDNIRRRLGIQIARVPNVLPDLDRAAAMADRYAAGETLEQIGASYSITRERVRQIIRDQTSLKPQDGGQAIRSRRAQEERATIKDQQYMDRLGCGWDEYKKIRQLGREMRAKGRGYYQTPLAAYISQRYNAQRRGIAWELNFWEWWGIWQASGRWDQRGRGQGYVMGRRGDVGAYSVANAFIITAIENTSSSKHKKSGLPTGVRLEKSGRFSAYRTINGRLKSLGTFATAIDAYAAYVAAAPGFKPHRSAYRSGASA